MKIVPTTLTLRIPIGMGRAMEIKLPLRIAIPDTQPKKPTIINPGIVDLSLHPLEFLELWTVK